ncbi:hypothetical protein BX667DRAFT_508703 [Coemansia mojavensis]|nr:hypothetical protein BX667DRAFT_508703 [Coemansia mojavensis]
MDSLNNIDIIYKIFYWFLNDKAYSITKWKDALLLLSVCSSWRQAGLKQLYRNILIEYEYLGRKHYSSNASLVLANGYGSLAKRIIVENVAWVDLTDFIIRLVGANEDNCPGVNAFTKRVPERKFDATSKHCPNMGRHLNAIQIHPRLASMLKSKLPNVSSFKLFQPWMPVADRLSIRSCA